MSSVLVHYYFNGNCLYFVFIFVVMSLGFPVVCAMLFQVMRSQRTGFSLG